MKSSFLVLALLGVTTAAKAQTSPSTNSTSGGTGAIPAGTVALGGGIGYSRQTKNDTRTSGGTATSREIVTSQFSFTPTIGYFITDNLEVGLNLGYFSYRAPYTTTTPAPSTPLAELDPSTALRIGPYARYYKMFTEQFGISGTLEGGYQRNRGYEYGGNPNNPVVVEFKGSGYYAGLTPAIVFFPVPKFAMSASIGSIGFNRINNDFPESPNNPAPAGSEDTSSFFGANFGLSQLQFGGTYYFGR